MAQRVGIKVAVRTRPTAAFDQDEIFVDANNAVGTLDLRIWSTPNWARF